MSSVLPFSYDYCERLTRKSKSSFFFAFRALPREKFREMCVLYAFMRRTDDLGDDPALAMSQRLQKLSAWEEDFRRALAGEQIPDPILTAMTHVVQRREIPPDYLLEVIKGVRTDLEPHEFRNFAELEAYCYQVAGVVGLACLRIWGFKGEEPREPALACGLAFQITNILRDLKEDAGNGRLYLPLDELSQFGYSRSDLQNGLRNQAFQDLMRFQVERARAYYEQSWPLREQLTPEGAKIFCGLHELYWSLLKEIEAADYDIFSRRITLPFWKKASVALKSLLP